MRLGFVNSRGYYPQSCVQRCYQQKSCTSYRAVFTELLHSFKQQYPESPPVVCVVLVPVSSRANSPTAPRSLRFWFPSTPSCAVSWSSSELCPLIPSLSKLPVWSQSEGSVPRGQDVKQWECRAAVAGVCPDMWGELRWCSNQGNLLPVVFFTYLFITFLYRDTEIYSRSS